MAKKTSPLLPTTQKLLVEFGERLKLARLRRRLTAKQVAERSGMSTMTLRSLESGGPGVTMGAYLSVMQVLGIEQDLTLLGAEDALGRHLQDSRLMKENATPPPVLRRGKTSVRKSPKNTTHRKPSEIPQGDEETSSECSQRANYELYAQSSHFSTEPAGITAQSLASLLQPASKKRVKSEQE